MASPRRTGFFSASGNALGDRRAVGLEAVVARDHEEFVAAHAHHEIGAGDGIAQSSRDRAKIVVADRVAARIVDVLEVVAVDVKDGQRIAAARGFVDEPRQLLVEEGAVRKARQRIVRGQMLQRQLVFLRAALGFAPVRDVLQQHGVHAAGAGIQIDDRKFHVAALIVAADELRRAALGGLILVAGRQGHRRVEDRGHVAAAQFVERSADETLRLRIRIEDPARTRVEQHDAGSGAIEDGAIAGFAGGRCRRSAAQPAAVGVPGGNHDADEQRDPADEVAHALLAVLHDGARQGRVHHRERMVVDGVEAQLALE